MDDVKRDNPTDMADTPPEGHPDEEALLTSNGASPNGDLSTPTTDGKDDVPATPEPEPVTTATPLMGRPVRGDKRDTTEAATTMVAASAAATSTNTLVEAGDAAQEAVAAPESTAAMITEPQPTAEQQLEVKRQPLWKSVVSFIVGSRWVFAIPAVLIALYAGRLVEDNRTSVISRSAVPPDQSWQLFAVAGALLVLAAWPRRARR